MKMKKIFDWYVLSKKEYNNFQHQEKIIKELKGMIEDNDIEKERLLLEQKYKKYIGKWYRSEDNIVFQIQRVGYKPNQYYEKYSFEAFAPNLEDWIDVSFDDVENKEVEHIPKDKVGEHLGI